MAALETDLAALETDLAVIEIDLAALETDLTPKKSLTVFFVWAASRLPCFSSSALQQ